MNRVIKKLRFASVPAALVASVLLAATSASPASATTIATWTSPTVDNGFLEGAAINYATGAGLSVIGAGLSPGTGASVGIDIVNSESPDIPNGEIVYATAPNGSVDDTTTAADAIADSQYFEFSFTVTGLSGSAMLDLDSFAYSTRRNSSTTARHGWDDSQLAYRVNDTSFTTADLIGGVNNDPDNGDVDSFTVTTGLPTGLVNGDVVNFRLYAWGSDNSGGGSGTVPFHGSSRLGGISIEGTLVPSPEPSALLLAMLGGLGLCFRRRRNRRG